MILELIGGNNEKQISFCRTFIHKNESKESNNLEYLIVAKDFV